MKQGTVLGPLLCYVNSVKINEIGEGRTNITPECQVYVVSICRRDVMVAGSKECIEAKGKNLRAMETF